MKTLFFLTLLSLFTLSACETPSTEDRIDEALDEAVEDAKETGEEFVEENAGGVPEEVMTAKYDLLLKQYGPLTYEAGLDTAGNRTLGHSDKIATDLGLDYETLVYIQIQSGTYGLQSMLDAMDSSIPEVAQLQEQIQTWHDVTGYDPVYFAEIMPKGLSDQEQVEFIVQTFADQYRLFSEGHGYYYISQPDALTQMVSLTGLDEENLTLIFAYGWIESVVELFPDTWEYKQQALDLVSQK